MLEDRKADIVLFVGPSGSGKSTLIHALRRRHPHYFGFSVSHTTRMPREGEQHGRDYFFVDKRKFKKMVEQGEMVEYTVMRANSGSVAVTPPPEDPGKAAPLSKEDEEMDEEDLKEKRALERAVEALIPLAGAGAGAPSRDKKFVIDQNVHTNYYGTSKPAIFQMLRLNKCVLMDTDLRGALTLRYTCHRVGQKTNTNTNPYRWPYTCCIILVLPPNMEVVQQRLLNRRSETPGSLKMRMELNRQWMRFYESHSSLFDHKVVTRELDECVREIEQLLHLESAKPKGPQAAAATAAPTAVAQETATKTVQSSL